MNKLRFDFKRSGEGSQEIALKVLESGNLKSYTPGFSALRFRKLG